MQAGLPKDPVMLLSVINTKLRDHYATLELLCDEMNIHQEDLVATLEMIDYHYDAKKNQFL